LSSSSSADDWNDALPQIPGYEIGRVLGQGGMGVVYQARDLNLQRPVALKMILAGAHAPRSLVARFLFEAEALAALHHPNIVQVYEFGEHQHCPYLAMEFVAGGSLEGRLREHRYSPREAAGLVETLARAMSAAHQRGIIHRDLKPGNILLDVCPDGTPSREPAGSGPGLEYLPKVSDFGLAKKLEEGGGTQTNTVLGTPAYMSPEQAAGKTREVGPHSDIYSLGVILYELLTGKVPFEGESVVLTLQRVMSEIPCPPRQRAAEPIPRDLETIALKCLHKEPAKRYATAEALADDLRRFLDGEPITARPVGRLERTWKWMRRRPLGAALVGVSVTAVAAVLTLWFTYSIYLTAAHARLTAAHARAERRSQLARRAVDDMYTQVAEQWLGDEPLMDEVKRQFLLKALRVYEELGQEADCDPSLCRETGQAQFRMGQIYRQLGRYDDAESAYRQAIHLQQELAQEQPGDFARQQELAATYNWLGELFRITGRAEQARGSYHEARTLLESLPDQGRSEPSLVRDLARVHYNDGLALAALEQAEAARRECEQAVRLLEGIGHQPGEHSHLQDLARARLNLGSLQRQLGKVEEAQASYRQAIVNLDTLLRGQPGKPEYRHEKAACYLNLGNLEARNLHRPEQARKEYDQARDLLEKLARDFPTRPTYQEDLANVYNSLGALEIAQQRAGEAAFCWEKSAELFERLSNTWKDLPRYQQRLAAARGNLGWLCLKKLGQPARARKHFEEAVRLLQAAREHDPDNREFRRELSHKWKYLVETALAENNDRAAASAVARFLEVGADPPADRYVAAQLLARCAGVAASPRAAGTPEERLLRQQQHGDEAMRQLLAVEQRPVPALRDLEREEAFAPLRDRSDFRRLLDRRTKNLRSPARVRTSSDIPRAESPDTSASRSGLGQTRRRCRGRHQNRFALRTWR
jgi:tetratricopeptide (TPR) repeat protein